MWYADTENSSFTRYTDLDDYTAQLFYLDDYTAQLFYRFVSAFQ